MQVFTLNMNSTDNNEQFFEKFLQARQKSKELCDSPKEFCVSDRLSKEIELKNEKKNINTKKKNLTDRITQKKENESIQQIFDSNISEIKEMSVNDKSNLNTTQKILNHKSPLKCDKSIKEMNVPKTVINKLISRLLAFSMKKTIPIHLSKKIFQILDDKSNFLELSEEKNILMKSLSPFVVCLKFFKNFIKEHNLIIHPYNNFKILWDIFHFLMMLFLFFYLPLDIIFVFSMSKFIRILLSILMFLDNMLGFSTAYFYHGKLITDRKKIFFSYFKSFVIDFLTQISLIYDIFLLEDHEITTKFIRLIILLRYWRFQQIYDTLVDRFKIDLKFGHF